MAKGPSKRSKVIRHGMIEEVVRSRVPRPRQPAQAPLPFDPMPDRVEPCLARLVSKVPTGPNWAYEVKWDGYRLAVHVQPAGVRVVTRGGHDWTHRFPAIVRTAPELASSAIFDGEAVVLDEQGRSDFGLLQQSLGGRGGKRVAGEAIFYAFDLLYLDGHDLRTLALSERRALLEELFSTPPAGSFRLSEEIDAPGPTLLSHACEMGLEGIIAKRLDRPYRSGRYDDWLKIKCVQSDSFMVVGYEPSTALPGAIGSLLLAARRGGELVYVGGVGTGFSFSAARALKKQLDDLVTKTPAVRIRGKQIVHVRPELVAEIEYRAWTHDERLRHPSFKGLREEADAADVLELGG